MGRPIFAFQVDLVRILMSGCGFYWSSSLLAGLIDMVYGVAMTIYLCHAPPALTLELDNPGAIMDSVWQESACDGLVIVCRWCCSTHQGSGIVLGVWWDVIVCVLIVLVAMFVDFRCQSNFIKNECPWEAGWCSFGPPFGLASSRWTTSK